MTLNEYKQKAENSEDWAPGWEAIDEAFRAVYGEQKPRHFATNLNARANLGGDQHLDGYSFYTSIHGYQHIVTYGMSELYANIESFGGEWSGWGYEMTFKIVSEGVEACLWGIDILANMAFFTNTQKSFLEDLQFIVGDGRSIDRVSDSRITALVITHDSEVRGVDTLHGRLDFLQLVGITQNELEAIMKYEKIEDSKKKIQELLDKMRLDNPYLATDMKRDKDYV